MKDRIKVLPYWCITDKGPAFYDTDSATAIEQTAKIYRAIRELQTDYNTFADEVNNCITEFMSNVNTDQEEFECHINKIIHDYIMMLDEKVKIQDVKIEDAVTYMKDNIINTTNTIIKEAIQEGKIYIDHTYDDLNKKVTISLKEEVETT